MKRKFKPLLLAFAMSVFAHGAQAQNIPQIETNWDCAIWLCLPAGFPETCAPAFDKMVDRLKKRLSPLPDWSICGGDAQPPNHNYALGREYWYPCDEGYDLRIDDNIDAAQCVTTRRECADDYGWFFNDAHLCQSYDAKRRSKTHYIDIWVDGQFLSRNFYM